jgi:immune inhibitor A
MRKGFSTLLLGALALALTVGVGLSAAASGNGQGRGHVDEAQGLAHNLETPLSKAQSEARAKGLELLLQGKVKKGQKVAKIPNGRYVELAREDTDRIFVVIAEFGDTAHAAYPVIPAANAQRFEGPLHNEIPQPDRSVDNTTLWKADYSKAHYEDMYFNRMAAYYERQSSGRYSVDGDVVEWVKVPFNQRRYGSNDCDVDGDIQIGVPGSADNIVCSNTWFLIRDAMAFWVKSQLDSGMTMAQINAYLSTFDVWDRYDIDGDGNFDEPDGVIDHFQIVHAGGDEAAGDPIYGQDAIWSHRWAAQISGTAGCPFDAFGARSTRIGMGGVSSGVTIPNNLTNYCVYDYTIQPENGGHGVFAHEYAHDLGLPDLYDTSGNTGGAENSTGFWTLMSSGSNIGDGGPDGIGDDPTDLGVWEKFQLGWLNYEVAFAGEKSSHKLGPAEFNTQNAQGLFVVLPDKEVALDLGDPFEGPDFFYSGAGDDLDNRMTKQVTVPAGGAFSAQVRYEIETDWDYAYLTVNGTPVATNLSTTTNPNGQNFGQGITGFSDDWDLLTADLSAFAGQTVTLGFRYWTDGAVAELGFQVDDITLGGVAHDTGWTFTPADGFRVTTGQESSFHFNAYVAENRQYTSYDTSLKTAYNFGFLNTKPDWVESFSYQDGLLVSYWDSSYTDNNVGDHPGEGLVLPVDAHPTFHHSYDGHLLRPRILSADSTFGKQNTKAITVHKDGQPTTIPSQPAVPTFDDTKDWWFNADQHAATGAHVGRYQPGWVGVKVPKTGTTVTVKSGGPQSAFLQVEVAPK